jgi:hypothetical protein
LCHHLLKEGGEFPSSPEIKENVKNVPPSYIKEEYRLFPPRYVKQQFGFPTNQIAKSLFAINIFTQCYLYLLSWLSWKIVWLDKALISYHDKNVQGSYEGVKAAFHQSIDEIRADKNHPGHNTIKQADSERAKNEFLKNSNCHVRFSNNLGRWVSPSSFPSNEIIKKEN